MTGPRKLMLQYLKVYRYKAYSLIKLKEDPDYSGKLQKLAPRAHIGYLVGYESTSIYRVWIPYKKKVILTRDVIFNEEELYNGKPVQISQELSISLDETVEEIALSVKKSLKKIQLQPEEALEIGEDDSDSDLENLEVKNLRDIEDID